CKCAKSGRNDRGHQLLHRNLPPSGSCPPGRTALSSSTRIMFQGEREGCQRVDTEDVILRTVNGESGSAKEGNQPFISKHLIGGVAGLALGVVLPIRRRPQPGYR